MVILLDTNVLLHLMTDPERLSSQQINAIEDASGILLTPLARSEICIKVSIGKLLLADPEPVFWQTATERLQAEELPYTCAHAEVLATLPLHHRDPFDRMIAAQCLKENFHLATTDAIFRSYGVKTIE